MIIWVASTTTATPCGWSNPSIASAITNKFRGDGCADSFCEYRAIAPKQVFNSVQI